MGPGVGFECDLNNNHFVDFIDNKSAIPIPRRKTRSKENNNEDYEKDDDNDDDDDDVLLYKDEFLMERQYLSDCIIERAKEDSSNLIPLPKPRESSLFYTNTKLITRICVRELTSFFQPTNKEQ